MAWVMTSSPTRLISWSTLSIETRSVVSAAAAAGLASGLTVARGA
jgi:hypothetical protein